MVWIFLLCICFFLFLNTWDILETISEYNNIYLVGKHFMFWKRVFHILIFRLFRKKENKLIMKHMQIESLKASESNEEKLNLIHGRVFFLYLKCFICCIIVLQIIFISIKKLLQSLQHIFQLIKLNSFPFFSERI